MHNDAIATALSSVPARDACASPAKNPPIYITASSKGGVGKSMTAIALLDLQLEAGAKILFVESDTANPDVYRCLERGGEGTAGVVLLSIKLDDREGWMELVDQIDSHRERVVVINGAARLGEAVQKYGRILREALPELNRTFVTLWLLNRQRDAMDQLREHREVFPDSVLHVVRNGLFGVESKFELYNGSRLRSQIETAGGKSLTLPELADRVADAIYTKRLAITDALAQMPLGSRVELVRWRKESHGVLEQIIA